MVLEEPVYEFEEVEFCQSKPVQVGGVYRMVRNPTTLITKASMCVRPCSSINLLKKWVMAVGVCEGSLSGGVPVLDAFARALRRNGKKCSAKMVKVVKGGTSRTITYTHTGGIDAETRHSFYIAWGISPAEQLALERHYDNWCLGDVFEVPIPGEDALDKAYEAHDAVLDLLDPSN
jgi:hypothetical protein